MSRKSMEGTSDWSLPRQTTFLKKTHMVLVVVVGAIFDAFSFEKSRPSAVCSPI